MTLSFIETFELFPVSNRSKCLFVPMKFDGLEVPSFAFVHSERHFSNTLKIKLGEDTCTLFNVMGEGHMFRFEMTGEGQELLSKNYTPKTPLLPPKKHTFPKT